MKRFFVFLLLSFLSVEPCFSARAMSAAISSSFSELRVVTDNSFCFEEKSADEIEKMIAHLNSCTSVVVIINGVSGSGKSSISRELKKCLSDWDLKAFDDDIYLDYDDIEALQKLAQDVGVLAARDKNVICDVVLPTKKDFNDFVQRVNRYSKNKGTIVTCFVYSSLETLKRRTELRCASGDPAEARNLMSVIDAWRDMLQPSPLGGTPVGTARRGTLDEIRNSPHFTRTSKSSPSAESLKDEFLNRVKASLKLLDDESIVFVEPSIEHDFIIHSEEEDGGRACAENVLIKLFANLALREDEFEHK